jgi:hypothetical protein
VSIFKKNNIKHIINTIDYFMNDVYIIIDKNDRNDYILHTINEHEFRLEYSLFTLHLNTLTKECKIEYIILLHENVLISIKNQLNVLMITNYITNVLTRYFVDYNINVKFKIDEVDIKFIEPIYMSTIAFLLKSYIDDKNIYETIINHLNTKIAIS